MGIREHEWGDRDIKSVYPFTGGIKDTKFIEVEIREDDENFTLVNFNKEDAVAIAKHFELTAEDLV